MLTHKRSQNVILYSVELPLLYDLILSRMNSLVCF
jgi:hypothetical protein